MDLPLFCTIALLVLSVGYGCLFITLHTTQDKAEPHLIPSTLPFIESAGGVLWGKTKYLSKIQECCRLPIFTLRMPFQRVYVVSATQLVQTIQSKANATTFVPNLLDFGILFSGMDKSSREILDAVYKHNNQFTASVHKYLLWGPTLQAATHAAVEKLATRMRSGFVSPHQVGLFEVIRHQLTLAMTGAIYGPENPFDDPAMEADWQIFVRGISHLANSPVPWLTAPSAIRARSRLTRGFKNYFDSNGHLQAFAMIPEMYRKNLALGITSNEVVKMEIATSLAMLSSGSITAFWLLYHILSNPTILSTCRNELLGLATQANPTLGSSKTVQVVDVSLIKTKCPNIMAIFHETFRYHSSVVSVKKVAHNNTLCGAYRLKKDAMVMIPGPFVHHDPDVWGANAGSFDPTRFLTAEGQKKLSTTTAFRPFGAGETMCPGRHFSTNVILTLVAIVVLRFDIEAAENNSSAWALPTTKNADMWNAMPKPDFDIPVRIQSRLHSKPVEFKFEWGADG